ncbi:transposase [Arthrobacter hankyongi]|uniref:transposase n=1 Tax=Arthrobacter hankyongi TaxID=2904801 RepID=UPI003556033E
MAGVTDCRRGTGNFEGLREVFWSGNSCIHGESLPPAGLVADTFHTRPKSRPAADPPPFICGGTVIGARQGDCPVPKQQAGWAEYPNCPAWNSSAGQAVIARIVPIPPAHSDRRNHRKVVNVILFILSTGAPWRDLPERYGAWKTVRVQLRKRTLDGTWEKTWDRTHPRGPGSRIHPAMDCAAGPGRGPDARDGDNRLLEAIGESRPRHPRSRPEAVRYTEHVACCRAELIFAATVPWLR